MNIQHLIGRMGKMIADNSPKILTAVGVAGVVSTTVLAVKATPEALTRIETAKEEKALELLTVLDTIKATWLCYIPAAAVGAVTITCIISGNSISTKRNAALVSLWTLTENGFREYQDKVVEHIGAKKEEEVRAEIAKDRIERDFQSKEVVIIGSGDVLFMDALSGRAFMSTMETVRGAQNDINEKVLNSMEGSASLNEFWNAIGLPRTNYGEEVGWSRDNTLDIQYSTTLSEDNRPCIAIEFRKVPLRGYYSNDFL